MSTEVSFLKQKYVLAHAAGKDFTIPVPDHYNDVEEFNAHVEGCADCQMMVLEIIKPNVKRQSYKRKVRSLVAWKKEMAYKRVAGFPETRFFGLPLAFNNGEGLVPCKLGGEDAIVLKGSMPFEEAPAAVQKAFFKQMGCGATLH